MEHYLKEEKDFDLEKCKLQWFKSGNGNTSIFNHFLATKRASDFRAPIGKWYSLLASSAIEAEIIGLLSSLLYTKIPDARSIPDNLLWNVVSGAEDSLLMFLSFVRNMESY